MQIEKYQDVVNLRQNALTLVSEKVRSVYESLPENIKAMDELSLMELFSPNPSDYWIRKRFWELVDLGEKIDTVLIISDKLSKQGFYESLLKNPYRVAWMFLPTLTHQESFEEMFKILHHRLLHYVSTTVITAKNVNAINSLYENLANRVVGPVAKNINLRAHMHSTSDQPTKKSPLELENELKQLKNATPVIDVDPT